MNQIIEMEKFENTIQERLSILTIGVLYGRFLSFPRDNFTQSNLPFHQAFLNAFIGDLPRDINVPQFISLASWFQGLNTTLGMTYFEGIAHILSSGTKREFTGRQGQTLQISQSQRSSISQIIADLKNSNRRPDVTFENEMIFSNLDEAEIATNEFTVDNYVENEELVECIELKTVRPNAGEMRGEKEKILIAKAALKKNKRNKDIKYFFGFPYDPWSETSTGYDKTNFIHRIIEGEKFLAQDEVLLAGELWDHLSGVTNSMEMLISIISNVASVRFSENILFIKDPQNIRVDKPRFISILGQWDLFKEIWIANNFEQLANHDRRTQRILFQELFDKDGKYNIQRANELISIL